MDWHRGNCRPARESNHKAWLLDFKGHMKRFVTFDHVGRVGSTQRTPILTGLEQRSEGCCACGACSRFAAAALFRPRPYCDCGVFLSLNSSQSESTLLHHMQQADTDVQHFPKTAKTILTESLFFFCCFFRSL